MNELKTSGSWRRQQFLLLPLRRRVLCIRTIGPAFCDALPAARRKLSDRSEGMLVAQHAERRG